MIDQQIDIPTKDGKTTTFITHPERGGPFAAAASLQGCGGCGRGGVLAPKSPKDKEMPGLFALI